METLGRLTVRFRYAILAVTVLVLLGAATFVPRLRIDVSSQNLLFVDQQVRQTFLRYLEEWGSDRLLTVGVRFTDGDAFTAERLQYVRDLTARLGRMPGVEKSESLTTTVAMSSQGESLEVEKLVPDPVPTDPATLARIRERTMASPLLRRMLVDDRGALVGINLRFADPGPDERKLMEQTRAIRELMRTAPRPPGATLHGMGGPLLLVEMYDILRRDLLILTAGPVLLIGILLIIVFRSLRSALLPLLTVIATAVITFGAMVATGYRINLVTFMLPCLMMVIGVADVIHVLVGYRETIAAGVPRHEAVAFTVKRVGTACLFTSLTTAAGFGSLILSDVPQVREFGIFSGVGVMAAFLLSVVSVPALLAVLRPPDPGRAQRLFVGPLARGLAWLHRVRYGGAALVGSACLILAVLGVLGILRLQVESSTREYLPQDHPLLREFDVVEQRLMGSVPILLHVQDARPGVPAPADRTPATPPARTAPAGSDEVIEDPEDRPAARPARAAGREILREPRILAVIDGLAAELGGLPYVRKVVGITEYLKEVHRVMHGGGAAQYRLPTDRGEVAAYLEMAAARDRAGLEKLVNFEYSRASVSVMTVAPTTRRVHEVLAKAHRYLDRADVKARLAGDVRIEITGAVPMLAHVARKVVNAQLQSFLSALGVIALMLILVLRSLRVGLLALLANLLPIVVTLGLMGWIGVPLNFTTVMIASIAIGIAVDDTIHLLVRAQNETALAAGDHTLAMERTVASVGRAVTFTSVVIAGGFSILALSTLVPARHFGLLTGLCMGLALLADLILTPLLIIVLRPWRQRQPPGEARSHE
jgi:hypothetical protein